MNGYSIELNDKIQSFKCPHCGEESKTVWGSVSKNGVAHAVYYANLMTGHQEPSVRLTVSIGGWGEEDLSKRKWAFIEARPAADVREPSESLYNGRAILGTPLSRSEVLASSFREELFAIADFIAFNDPAVKSYLLGEQVSSEGREGKVN